MENISQLERMILANSQDDYYGLWELIMDLQRDFPEKRVSDLVGAAQDSLRKLLARGWIYLLSRPWAVAEYTRLNPDEMERILSDKTYDRYWVPKSIEIVIDLTEEGERIAYGR